LTSTTKQQQQQTTFATNPRRQEKKFSNRPAKAPATTESAAQEADSAILSVRKEKKTKSTEIHVPILEIRKPRNPSAGSEEEKPVGKCILVNVRNWATRAAQQNVSYELGPAG